MWLNMIDVGHVQVRRKGAFTYVLIVLQKTMSTEADVIARADALHDADEIPQLLSFLEANATAPWAPHSCAFQWRLSRALGRMGVDFKDGLQGCPPLPKDHNAKYIDYNKRALVHAERALRLNDKDSYAQLQCGAILGNLAVVKSPKEQILDAHRVLSHFHRVLDLDPNNFLAHHCIGVAHWHLLQLGRVMTAIASLLFAPPPKADAEACERHLRKCYELAPTNVMNAVALGEFLVARGNKKEAAAVYRNGLHDVCVSRYKLDRRAAVEAALRKIT